MAFSLSSFSLTFHTELVETAMLAVLFGEGTLKEVSQTNLLPFLVYLNRVLGSSGCVF